MKAINYKNLLLIVLIIAASSFSNLINAQTSTQHEYTQLVEKRFEEAINTDGNKDHMVLAEGSLMALGWFVLYGNDDASFTLAKVLNTAVVDQYNGTDKMDIVYMNHTSTAYAEMLNLNRFDSNKPICLSTEYESIAKERVGYALKEGAKDSDFKLAEASLVALGWATLYGTNKAAVALGSVMMYKAYALWPMSNEVYMMQSSEAYGEIINLGRFKMDKADN